MTAVIEQLPSGNLLGLFGARLVEFDAERSTVWRFAPPGESCAAL